MSDALERWEQNRADETDALVARVRALIPTLGGRDDATKAIYEHVRQVRTVTLDAAVARTRDEPSPPAILGAPSADDVEDEYRRSRDAAVRVTERARIVAMARARAAQYMSDGWDRLADAVNNFAREIEC
jgi:hypothetical protein